MNNSATRQKLHKVEISNKIGRNIYTIKEKAKSIEQHLRTERLTCATWIVRIHLTVNQDNLIHLDTSIGYYCSTSKEQCGKDKYCPLE